MSIELYTWPLSAAGRAVQMTAKELNIDLDIKLIDLTELEHLNPEFLQLNPAHTVPTINDNGFILWESRAIMAYLCSQYAPDSTLYPTEPKTRALVDRWLNLDMTFTSAMREATFPKLVSDIEPKEDIMNAYEDCLELMDQLIGDDKYLTGDELTIADLSLLATTVIPYKLEHDFTEYPNFKRWYLTLSTSLPYFDEINNFSKADIESIMNKIKEKIRLS